MLITFEGPEGSGKTTQIPIATEWLRSKGFPVVVTREPGGTDIGDQVRGVLTRLSNTSMGPSAELFLFLASRAQLTYELIQPALADGNIVVCDRFTDATLAYQGYGHGLDLAFLKSMNTFATQGRVPDLTILLDVDPEVGIARRRSGGGEWNRLDAMQMEFHKKVRSGYHSLVAQEPWRWRVVDASRSHEEVSRAIIDVLEQCLIGDCYVTTG